MDLYEKAGDTFFNGSRNRDRAVEFYRVLIPPSISVVCPCKAMPVGSFAPGLAAALHGQAGGVEGGKGWGGPESKLCCSGEAWSTDVFYNGCSSSQRSPVRREQRAYITNPGSVRCELVAAGDMLRVRISGT